MNKNLQLLKAIQYLHSKEILHRDISFNNILIKQYDDDLISIKVSDFGLIKENNSDLTSTGSEIKGTIIDDTLVDFKNYNIKNEIYAIGVVLFYIFTGKQSLELINNAISNIVKKCVNRNHSNRYDNVSEIIEDVKKMDNVDESKNKSIIKYNNKIMENGLNELALEMLQNAIDGDGVIIKSNTIIGLTIQCGTKTFTPANAKEEANMEYSMELLIDNDYIKGASYKGEIFKVTKKGFVCLNNCIYVIIYLRWI